MKSDLKIKEDQCEQLNQEILDVGSHGSKEVMEVANLKKTKRELEAKNQDLEEELDDQAGQIQMLEQVSGHAEKFDLRKLAVHFQLEGQCVCALPVPSQKGFDNHYIKANLRRNRGPSVLPV